MKYSILFCVLCALPLLLHAQDENHWDTYQNNRLEYPIVSPAEGKMMTPFVGLQIDEALLNNRRRGYILQKAGFRKDEKTGEIRCFEAVFSDGTTAYRPNNEQGFGGQRFKIAVELVAFDTRSPQQRVAAYEAQWYNISFDQESGIFRCQIPITTPLHENMAFVLLAHPPYLSAGIQSYNDISKAQYFEGPWATDPKKTAFKYPASGAPKEIQPDKNNPVLEIPPLKYGQVYNDYGYPVPAKHYEWSKKGSNFARSFQSNNKYGMRADDGSILIEAQYDELHFGFSGFMLAKKDGKAGVINEGNQVVLPFEYERLELLYNNGVCEVPRGVALEDMRLLARKPDGLVGIINGRGKILSPFRACRSAEVVHFYDAPRHENLGIILSYPGNYNKLMRQTAIIISSSEGCGVVSANGATILPFEYREIASVSLSRNATWVRVIKEEKVGLYDLRGKWVLEPKYEDGFGLFANLNHEKNTDFANMIEARFSPPQDGDNYVPSGTGIVDTLGNIVLPFEYNDLSKTFVSGGVRHFWAQKVGLWGVVDINNKVVVPFMHREFVRQYEFEGKLYLSLKDSTNTLYGMLSMDNKMVLPFQYTYFADGNSKLLVVLDKSYKNGLVNMRGEVVLPLQYSNISLLPNDHFFVQEGNLCGIANPEGKVVVLPTYRGLYGENYFPSYQKSFDEKAINTADVVAILTDGNKNFVYLVNGTLVPVE